MDDTEKGFFCHCTTKSYHLIENYRSVLNRKQPEISTWKILDHAGQISFTRGAHYRRGSDVLAIRLNRLYLIHPWYEYVDIDQQLFAGLQPKRSSQILEVVLLERVDPTGEQGFELAIVECPCLEKQGVFCTHCQCTLAAMKEVHLCASRNIARSLDQQTVVSVSLGISQDRIDSVEQSVSSTVIAVQVSETQSSATHHSESLAHLEQGTQTKLHAILLPPSPLSEMRRASIDARTLSNVTRSCQVNTLSYLMKTEGSPIVLPFSIATNANPAQKDLAKTPFSLNQGTEADRYVFVKGTLIDHETSESDSQSRTTVPVIEFNKEEVFQELEQSHAKATPTNEVTLSSVAPYEDIHAISFPSRCINALDNIIFDGRQLILSPNEDHPTPTNTSCLANTAFTCSNDNNSERPLMCNGRKTSGISPVQHRCRSRTTVVSQFESSEPLPSSCSSSFIIAVEQCNQFEKPVVSQPSNVRKRVSSIADLVPERRSVSCQYQARHHLLLARATKASTAHRQFQSLLNDKNASVTQLIDSQLRRTCGEGCRSVCIVLDDNRSAERHRCSFLQSIYSTMSNELARIFVDESIQLTTMNLVFFNNAFYNMVNRQRMRLIDTGKKIYLQPSSCEISVRNISDINRAISRLSPKTLCAHQILIVNCSSSQLSASGSFLFLQLAPITSNRSSDLFANLNGGTYSVMNLLRRLNKFRPVAGDRRRQCLFNDCLLNRLLKSYLVAPQQNVVAFTIKPKADRPREKPLA